MGFVMVHVMVHVPYKTMILYKCRKPYNTSLLWKNEWGQEEDHNICYINYKFAFLAVFGYATYSFY